MRSGNPSLSDKTFQGLESSANPMTLNGTVNKTAMLLALMMITAVYTWGTFFATGDPASITPYLWVGVIGGLIIAIATIFLKKYAGILAPLYALFEGLAIGGISAFYEARYPGVVIQAAGLTFGTLLCLLIAYRTGAIKATENFKLGIVAATGAIFLLYVVNMILSMFGMPIGFIHESGTFGIIFSLVVVVIAALNLVLDFDFIETGVARGAPKYMEWYAAFGLLVTLVWLYLEMLRLLGKLRNN